MLARESLFEVELQKQDSLDEELYSILVRQARYRGAINPTKIALQKLGFGSPMRIGGSPMD